jgi:superfamily II DNA/RNA helicase
MPFSKIGDKFGGSSEIKNTVVYGGVPKHKQVRDLRSGIEIVIATPVSFDACLEVL